MNLYYVYFLTNKNRTTLYIGYTDNLERRNRQHKSGSGAVFTKKYNVYDLHYFEVYEIKKLAKDREKQLKNWHKEWKWNLVIEKNPELKTLELENRS